MVTGVANRKTIRGYARAANALAAATALEANAARVATGSATAADVTVGEMPPRYTSVSPCRIERCPALRWHVAQRTNSKDDWRIQRSAITVNLVERRVGQ